MNSLINELPGDIRLSITVLHHTERAGRLLRLLGLLDAECWRVRVQMDVSGEPPSLEGLGRNFLEAAIVPLGATHHLVLQDDAVPCRDFVRSLGKAIAARPCHAVAPYSNRAACRLARTRGSSWAELSGELWGISICMPTPWWAEFRIWNKRAFTTNERFHDDARVALFLASQDRSTWCTVPSLLDHDTSTPSLLKHNSRVSTAAWALSPDVSGLTVDWDNGLSNAPKSGVSVRSLLKYHRREINREFWLAEGWVLDGF